MQSIGEAMAAAMRGLRPDSATTMEEYTYEPIEIRERRKEREYNASTGDLDRADGYNCDACHNRGNYLSVYMHNGMWYETYAECECMTARRGIQRLRRSGLEIVVQAYTFDAYRTSEPWQGRIKDAALRYCDDLETRWFFIGGAVGAGKSHICTAIASNFLTKMPVQYVLWVDEIARLKAVQNDNEYATRTGWLKTVDVLYIDDLFKITQDRDGRALPPTAADIKIAHEIINARYNARLRTIISSERQTHEIMDIDQAIGGRIAERARGYTLNITRDRARDYRMKIAGEAI